MHERPEPVPDGDRRVVPPGTTGEDSGIERAPHGSGPASPDGQFDDDDMPTTDGELSDPDPGSGEADTETGR